MKLDKLLKFILLGIMNQEVLSLNFKLKIQGYCMTTSLRSHKDETKKPRMFAAFFKYIGAGNEIRTRDPNLGKVVLYH